VPIFVGPPRTQPKGILDLLCRPLNANQLCIHVYIDEYINCHTVLHRRVAVTSTLQCPCGGTVEIELLFETISVLNIACSFAIQSSQP